MEFTEAQIVHRRSPEMPQPLSKETEISFHAALRMLRELMERVPLRHGSTDRHRNANDEHSVISWFLPRQSLHTLAELFLEYPDHGCKARGGLSC